jgi:hypothetical protein
VATRCKEQIAEVEDAVYQRTDALAILLACAITRSRGRRRRCSAVGAEAQEIACTLISIDAYSLGMGGCLQ